MIKKPDKKTNICHHSLLHSSNTIPVVSSSFLSETPANHTAMAPHGEGSEEALVVQDENRKPISSILIIIGTMLYFSISYLFIWVSFVPLFMCFCVCNSYANPSTTSSIRFSPSFPTNPIKNT